MKPDDIILAFFPCTRFEAQILLWFRGESPQQKNHSDIQKLESDLKLHSELSLNYKLITELAIVVLRKNLKMVFENPLSEQHYLTRYWCLKPKVCDKNRRLNGDYMIKPTQFWFIGFEPKNNIIFEPIDWVEYRNCNDMRGKDGRNKTVLRSEIHPQYASRFIRKYLIDYEQDFSKLYEEGSENERAIHEKDIESLKHRLAAIQEMGGDSD